MQAEAGIQLELGKQGYLLTNDIPLCFYNVRYQSKIQ